jgi:hypothetical protein
VLEHGKVDRSGGVADVQQIYIDLGAVANLVRGPCLLTACEPDSPVPCHNASVSMDTDGAAGLRVGSAVREYSLG